MSFPIERLRFLMTLHTTVANGTAAAIAAGPSNITLFNRKPYLLRSDAAATNRDELEAALARLFAWQKVGDVQLPLLQALSGGQLTAALFTAQIPLLYGAGEGTGLFSGQGRYDYLYSRLGHGAASRQTLVGLWDYLAQHLGLPLYPDHAAPLMFAFAQLPQGAQALALRAISEAPQLITHVAKEIARGVKLGNPDYAAHSKDDPTELVIYQMTKEQIDDLVSADGVEIVTQIPAISDNGLRHVMLREPMAWRLLHELGVDLEDGEILPSGVERLLFNGGNVEAGASEPRDRMTLEKRARVLYPSLDALGGCFDSFLMARSQASITGFVVCRENNEATMRYAGISSPTSIFDMLAETTRTRTGVGGKDKESGQMIFSYEVLAAGIQVLALIDFLPYTHTKTIGATVQALADFQEFGIIGARGATGHGRISLEMLPNVSTLGTDEMVNYATSYLNHLRMNADTMRKGLLDGCFGVIDDPKKAPLCQP